MTVRRVGIVGLGIGGAHADGFRRVADRFEIAVVADTDPGRVRDTVAWVGCEGASGLDEVCARTDVDIVALATPPFLHRGQIEQVLRAGKDVICEKPLVGSLAEVDELVALEAETGRWVMPIFQYRYGRGLQKLRALVDAGVTGACHTVAIDVSWRRRADYYAVPWRGQKATELGGVLLSHALHAIDMATHVVGPVDRVFARTATRVNDIETEDTASASMRLVAGGFVTLSATLGSPEEVTRHRFCFERLVAESNTDPYENHREPWTFVGDSDADTAAIAEVLSAFVPEAELYKGQFVRLADALDRGAPPPVTLADARAALEIITAAYRSAAEGVDVALPIAAGDPYHQGWS